MQKLPIFLLAGRDKERREIMKVLDPEKRYKSKCQLDMLGKPIIQWVVDELQKSEYVDQIYVLGLGEEDLQLEGDLEYILVDYDAEVFDKIKAGFDYLKSIDKYNEMAVMCGADIPAVTVESIDEFLKEASEKQHYDFVWGVVPEEVAAAEFPDHGRTVGHFKDHSLFPGDIFALNHNALVIGETTIRQLSDNRRKRSFWTTVWLIAKRPRTWRHLIKIILKTATTKDGIKLFEKAFRCKVAIVIIKELGFGYDMDLLVDYERLTKYVSKTKNIPLID
ncbi:MAG: NTP transferase domain-containing protein [Candidatus Heimdallarchaeota archaeon]|nr:NTP transferase domain-containing protein [Candidatus Heimdallarchaeota archaeon]